MNTSLVAPLVVVGSMLVSGLVAAGVARYRRPDTPADRQQVVAAGNLSGFLLAAGGLFLLGVGESVVGAVPGPQLHWFAQVFLAVLVAFAGGLPAVATSGAVVRIVVDGEPFRTSARDAALGLVPTGIAGLGGTVALIVAAKSAVPASVAVVPPLTILAYSASLGAITVRTRTTEPASAAPTAAVERALERTGFDPDRVHLLPDDSEVGWRPAVAGLGPTKRVIVPPSSFEDYDDETLETLLVMLTRSGRLRVYRIVAGWSVVGAALTVVLAGERLSTAAVGGAVLLTFIGAPAAVWGGRRIVYRNDAAVAATLGADRVVDALVAQDERRGGDEPSLLQCLLVMMPSIEKRVERLGGDVSRLPSTDDGPRSAPGSGAQPGARGQPAPRGSPSRPDRRSGQSRGGRPPQDRTSQERPPQNRPPQERPPQNRPPADGRPAQGRPAQQRRDRAGEPPRDGRGGRPSEGPAPGAENAASRGTQRDERREQRPPRGRPRDDREPRDSGERDDAQW
jgi:hypothetical protein